MVHHEAVLTLLILTVLAQTNTTNATQSDASSSSKRISDEMIMIIIIMIIAGGFLIAVSILWIYRRCSKIQRRKEILKNYRARYRVSKIDTIPEEEYEEQLAEFKKLLEDVKIRTKIYYFTPRFIHIPREVIFTSFTVKKRDDFDAQITIIGSDSSGPWQAKGGFILTEAGPFFWMIKWYDDELNFKGSVRDTQVFQSTRVSPEGAQGRWFEEEKPRSSSQRWQIVPTQLVGGPN